MIGRHTRSTQRLRIAVGVVGPAEAVLVVGDPGNGRVVGAEGRAREQQPEAGAVEGPAGPQAPGGLIAHVVRLVGDQQGRPAAGGQPVRIRPGRDRLVGDGDAVEVGRLRPVRVRPVRLEVDAVAARVGGPLAADVGGRAGDDDARDELGAQHPVGDVQAEGGLAGRRRGRGQEAGGRVRPHGLGRLLLPRAEGSGIGPIRKRSGTRPAADRVLRGVVQGRATIGSPAVGGRPTPHGLDRRRPTSPPSTTSIARRRWATGRRYFTSSQAKESLIRRRLFVFASESNMRRRVK